MRAPGPGGGTLEILPLFVLRDEGLCFLVALGLFKTQVAVWRS